LDNLTREHTLISQERLTDKETVPDPDVIEYDGWVCSVAARSRRELLLLWTDGREQVEHGETYIHKEPENNY
jgi:hypothetical protein